MDEIVHANPHGRNIGVAREMLRQTDLFVQRLDASIRNGKGDEKCAWNAQLQVVIDEIDVALRQRRCADTDDVARTERQINEFNFPFLLSMGTG